jgi:DNA repair exonuclease SbcCD ATPase subunit
MDRLVIIHEGKMENEVYSVNRVLTTVGSGAENTVTIKDDMISEVHAEIENLGDGKYRIRDCNSESGTFVNGERIEEAEITAGDTLRFACLLAKIEVAEKKEPTVEAKASVKEVRAEEQESFEAPTRSSSIRFGKLLQPLAMRRNGSVPQEEVAVDSSKVIQIQDKGSKVNSPPKQDEAAKQSSRSSESTQSTNSLADIMAQFFVGKSPLNGPSNGIVNGSTNGSVKGSIGLVKAKKEADAVPENVISVDPKALAEPDSADLEVMKSPKSPEEFPFGGSTEVLRENEILHSDNAALKGELEYMEDYRNRLEREHQVLLSKLREDQAEAKVVSDQLHDVVFKLEKTRKELEEAKLVLGERSAAVRSEGKKFASLVSRIASDEKRQGSLKEAHEQLLCDLPPLRSELIQLRKEEEGTREALTVGRQQVTEAKNELAVLQEALKSLQLELESERKEESEVSRNLEASRKEYEKLQQAIRDGQAARSHAEFERNRLNSEAGVIGAKLAAIRGEHQKVLAVCKERKVVEEAVGKARAELAELEQNIEWKREDLATLIEQERRAADLQRLADKFRAETEALGREILEKQKLFKSVNEEAMGVLKSA